MKVSQKINLTYQNVLSFTVEAPADSTTTAESLEETVQHLSSLNLNKK